MGFFQNPFLPYGKSYGYPYGKSYGYPYGYYNGYPKGGGGGPHMVKINHMVKIWKISSKNPNHYYLLNLHLQLLKSNLCCETTGGAAPGRRQRRDRPTTT